MNQRVIVYDTPDGENTALLPPDGNTFLFHASSKVKKCTGCFGCWIKTPGACVLKDACASLPLALSQCGEAIIISPVLYGGFSVNIKAVLERCIPYLLPFFKITNGEMHHTIRYRNPFQLHAAFYGPCDAEERGIAERLVRANALNMGAGGCTISFFDSLSEAKEAVL